MPQPCAAKILCIDDEPAGLHFRKLVLESAGYAVETAASLAQALELLRDQPFDLVVTDHLLGRGSGTAMAMKIKQARPGTPVIVFSGTVDLPEGLGMAETFLSKTDGPEALLGKVRELLEATPAGGDFAAVSPEIAANALQDPRLQRLLLSALVDSSYDAILSKTPDGIILTWNKAAEKMYGYTPQETIGKSVSMLVPPDAMEEFHTIMRTIRRGEKIDNLETRRVTKDGRLLMVTLTISPIRDADAWLVGAATVTRDVTPVRMAELALRNSERLAIAGRMAATVAHEINNPLETVTNILYLLQQTLELDPMAREFLGIAEREVARIRQIAQLTLKYHRSASLSPEPVDMPELIDSVLTLYGRRIQTLGISVEKEYEPNGTVEGIAGELRQVISNLILNAIEALEHSGDRLRIRVHRGSDWNGLAGVRVVIADRGPGISAQHVAALFQPFFTTKGERGTGLGLWVSRGIIEKHGGTIRVRSATRPGASGTVFLLFLPLRGGAPKQQAAA
ncbi:MAG: PAS domain S-box protein [Candidatus Korobacteraceae bacterium]|jgi:two-component system CheB/CheR fusion protein